MFMFVLICYEKYEERRQKVALSFYPFRTQRRHGKKLTSVGLDPRDDDDHKIEYTMKVLDEELNQAGLQRISDIWPSIPSFPWNGFVAISAFFSPRLYKFLQRKREIM